MFVKKPHPTSCTSYKLFDFYILPPNFNMEPENHPLLTGKRIKPISPFLGFQAVSFTAGWYELRLHLDQGTTFARFRHYNDAPLGPDDSWRKIWKVVYHSFCKDMLFQN